MKKRIKKLRLNRETILKLDELESELAKGGVDKTMTKCALPLLCARPSVDVCPPIPTWDGCG
ncbi:MAG: hypothetical protein GY851_00230 [bacterium]|nr:hypothetical protein [bacterium]